MITNARDRTTANQVGELPQMGDTLRGWFQVMYFNVVTKRTIDAEVVESEETVKTHGVRQPLSRTKLEQKPQGQRAWKWDMVHAVPTLSLKLDDVVTYRGVRYRVMFRGDFPEYGYLEYHLVEDWVVSQNPASGRSP